MNDRLDLHDRVELLEAYVEDLRQSVHYTQHGLSLLADPDRTDLCPICGRAWMDLEEISE